MRRSQHKCLRLITQTLASSSKEVLNLITNVTPIDLHFKLRLSESLARIMSRNSPINTTYDAWKTGNLKNRFTKITTTYRKLELASQQILKKNINQHSIPRVELYDSRFPPFIKTSDIIPSENTKEQQKTKVISMIRENVKYDYIIGTDGSTLKDAQNDSLGPSAAAAIVLQKDDMREPVNVLTTNLGPLSHNYEAELAGIQLALQHLQQQGISHSKILIVSDCLPAMEATFTNNINVDYNHTIMRNKDLLHSLKTFSHNLIEAVWAPGHEGILINEMADQFAKEEAAKVNKTQIPLERKIVLTHLKQEVLVNWQRRVNLELSNHQIMEINNRVKDWKIFNTKESKHLTRMITGHHFLNTFQSKINSKTSKYCSCGQTETIHHFLFSCQRYNRFRQRWTHRVVCITEDLEDLNHMSLTTAFGQREDLSEEKNRNLQESACMYINETNRFISS
jgi:ribonuclease HI